jgi:fructoselysine 6-kinase
MAIEASTSKLQITAAGYCGIDRYIDKNAISPGGMSMNFALHARKIFPHESNVRLVGVVGDDKYGQVIEKTLVENHVIDSLHRKHGPTPILDMQNDASGEKIFVQFDEGVLADFVLTADQRRLVRASDVVASVLVRELELIFDSIVDCHPLQFLATDFSNLAGYSSPEEIVKKYIPNIDVGFFGLTVRDRLLMAELQQISNQYNKLLVVTLGENGSMAFDSGEAVHAPAVQVDKVIDTAGAGDSFAAMFVYALFQSGNIEHALIAGNAYAAQTIQKVGAF